MTSPEILKALGPCGLSCIKCYAHRDGEIRKAASNLKKLLGNFEVYAKRFETMLGDPVFKSYPDFRIMLDYLAAGHCNGCRQEECRLFKACGVRICHQRKLIDFCHQCSEFPCDHTGFDEHLHARWIKLNERIRQTGVERFCEETKDKPRYP